MNEILFICRKCWHELTLELKDDATAEDVLKKLKKVRNMYCPGCGEEPCENWMLDKVTIAKKK